MIDGMARKSWEDMLVVQPPISGMTVWRRDRWFQPSHITEAASLPGVTLGSIYKAVRETLSSQRAESAVVYLRGKQEIEVEYERGWVDALPGPLPPWDNLRLRRQGILRRH
jgi:hypothetical protein